MIITQVTTKLLNIEINATAAVVSAFQIVYHDIFL